ncbi:unnamed protein product, partial [Discosporangium mesarthrocarpum]
YLYPADGSGTIDSEEMAPLLRELGVPAKRRMVDELMAHLDKDGSGDIGRDELTAWMATVRHCQGWGRMVGVRD